MRYCVSLIYSSTRVLVSQASVVFRSCCMLQDLAVGLLHFSGRARMCHRRMRMYLAHRTRTPPKHFFSMRGAYCSELPPGSAVLARPEAVLVTANVLWLRLSRVRIGRGRLCLLSRGNSDI